MVLLNWFWQFHESIVCNLLSLIFFPLSLYCCGRNLLQPCAILKVKKGKQDKQDTKKLFSSYKTFAKGMNFK